MWDHGDWAQIDEDGFWFLQGRADDALNVAGRKVGAAEIEDVHTEHDAIVQAAAVGVPDDTIGTAVVSFIVIDLACDSSEELRTEHRELVGKEQGKPFRPRKLLFVDNLPKSQSGKIIRRILSAVYQGKNLGDLSSIENSESLEQVRKES